MNIVVRPAAVTDIQHRSYYDDEVPRLSEDLVSELDQLFAWLAAFPRSAPRSHPLGVSCRLRPERRVAVRALARHV